MARWPAPLLALMGSPSTNSPRTFRETGSATWIAAAAVLVLVIAVVVKFAFFGSAPTVQRLHLLEAGHGGTAGAIAPDGSIWLWGASGFPNATHDENDRLAAYPLKGLRGAVALSVQREFVLALKADGTVWGIGRNGHNQLGPSLPNQNVIAFEWVAIPGATDMKAIVAEHHGAVALKRDGTVWAWGWNDWGRLGPGISAERSAAPVQIKGLSNIVQITAGNYGNAFFAVDASGNVWAWGQADAIGIPHEERPPSGYVVEPVMFNEPKGVARMAVNRQGMREWLATDPSGHVTAWGSETGTQCNQELPYPHPIPAFAGAKMLAHGTIDSYALMRDGSVWIWGLEDINGRGVCMQEPKRILPPGTAVEIAASATAGYLVKPDGSVWSWGHNTEAQQFAAIAQYLVELPKLAPVTGLPRLLP
ncbi:MAG TPA: hypothetical protein VFV17_03510 [Usitatibacteraceae bacterium]|nr:hypothetical protein [Usitatibacteraceae bacterium]